MDLPSFRLTQLIDMIVKTQVIIDVYAQKFNTVFISYGAAWDLNFQFLQIRWLFSAFDIKWLLRNHLKILSVFFWSLKMTESRSDEQA